MTRKRQTSGDRTLSDLQLQVMQVLWSREEASAADVQQQLAGSGRELALTTVATLLTRLAKRDLILTRREGRQVFYRSAVSEGEVKRGMVSNLLGALFAGDPKALVTHLVKETDLSAGDLEKVRKLLEGSNKENSQ